MVYEVTVLFWYSIEDATADYTLMRGGFGVGCPD
jgi:hypothetical protein